ncbi:MAG TPA: hypothetical protein PK926_13245 [Spirochaetota bacterium]|nr:hypothetical protein [Spirochaetota bacterium]HPI89973.1 hypothetical protein [Spirochaetota bacterium]HPR48408.1 hypothetical protein [Spirochaetota bacterium]
MKTKIRIIGISLVVIGVIALFIYFRFFFTYEQRNVFQRKIETITGQNLTVTVFGFDGRIIKRWEGVQKISSGRMREGSGERNYTFFYTRDNKYVQIPDSIWYIAEEQ